PRERLVANGPDALSHGELVAILLRTGLKGANVLDIANQLLTKYGSLQSLARASIDDLQTIKGIGRDKAVTLIAAFTLARKMAQELRREAPLLDTPERVADLLREDNRMFEEDYRQAVLRTTTRNLMDVGRLSHGTL